MVSSISYRRPRVEDDRLEPRRELRDEVPLGERLRDGAGLEDVRGEVLAELVERLCEGVIVRGLRIEVLAAPLELERLGADVKALGVGERVALLEVWE